MTAAALVGLTASARHLKDTDRASEVLEKGWKAFSDAKGSPTKSEGYMLHLTAELGRLVGKPAFKVGEKSIPWYENGAAKLVKSQQADGSWKLGKGLDEVEVYGTAAALYFLGPPTK